MAEQSPDPVVDLLIQPENIGLACEIYNAFPKAVEWAGKVRLLRILRTKCKDRLGPRNEWDVSLDPSETRELLEEAWPGIYLMPGRQNDRYWYFCLEMDARDIPFTLHHGVVYQPDKGGRPQSMHQELKAEVEAIEREFKDEGFRVRPFPGEHWFSFTDKPYKQNTLGDDPRVMARISSGALADEIAAEFMQFFDDWVAKIERLNSLLRQR